MKTFDRRHLLTTAVGTGAAVATVRWLEPTASAVDDQPKERIKIGQIGTGHEHASAKMATYTPSHSGLEVRFGSLAQCIRAALTGEWDRERRNYETA